MNKLKDLQHDERSLRGSSSATMVEIRESGSRLGKALKVTDEAKYVLLYRKAWPGRCWDQPDYCKYPTFVAYSLERSR